MAHFAAREKNQVVVVAPIPMAPSWVTLPRWKKWTRIPAVEQRGNLRIYHPTFPMIPLISLPLLPLLMFLGSILLVCELHREFEFDVIGAHFVYPDGLGGVLLGKVLKVPTVVSARGTDINQYPMYSLIRPQIRYSLRNAAGAIAVCKALQDVMVSLAGPGHESRVIGNGVDTSRFFSVERKEARQKLRLQSDAPLSTALRAPIPRKGYHLPSPAC